MASGSQPPTGAGLPAPARGEGAGERGRFVTLEGGEGAGKSTLGGLLRQRLAAAGRPAIVTREPGGTPLGEIVRQLIRKPALARRFYAVLGDETAWKRVSPAAELLLFAAARAQHVDALIRPKLEDGVTVICDRFAESTIAYQGYGRGLPRAEIDQAIALATRGLRPDLIVLLDLPVAAGLARKRGELGRDQLGQETLAFHERVRRGYLEMAAAEPTRWLTLDATRPPQVLAGLVLERLTR
jgi:dTMP kinase